MNIFSHTVEMPFYSTDGVLCWTEAFYVDRVPLVHLCFCFPCLRRHVDEKAVHVYIQETFAHDLLLRVLLFHDLHSGL